MAHHVIASHLSIAHRRDLFQLKSGRTSAPLFPRPTDEQRLYVAKPDVIGPAVAADRDRVAAPIIRAIDQETANAHVAHVAEGDFLRAGHAAMIALRNGQGKKVV